MRQIRLSAPDQIRKRLKEFMGKKINIVLHNRKVLFGELTAADDDRATLVNLRDGTFPLPLKEISEVYMDYKD